jgi:ARG and Rhodanese-Phosphatase-superfamily-associated Protein domain
MPAFPEVQVGDPFRHEALAVFPLFGPSHRATEYLLADEALAAGTVTVEEVSEAGSVPTLVVTNQADALVLFLEGEELRGAKQNRVLNTSLLAAAKARTPIPVSCVEHGRWRYASPSFGHAGSHSSSKLRHVLKRSVSESAKAGQGHLSDQGGSGRRSAGRCTPWGRSPTRARWRTPTRRTGTGWTSSGDI